MVRKGQRSLRSTSVVDDFRISIFLNDVEMRWFTRPHKTFCKDLSAPSWGESNSAKGSQEQFQVEGHDILWQPLVQVFVSRGPEKG